MVTVTINIKPYLARYMYVRYRQSLEPDPENQSHSSSPSSSKRLIPIHLSTLLQFITSFINYLSLICKILHGKKLEIFALYCPNRVMGRIRKSIIISETIVH